MLQRAMRTCGQRFGLPILLVGYLLLLCLATPSFAMPTGTGKATTQASTSSPQVELEGELEVLHEDDFKNKKSRIRHFLKTDSGDRYELRFKTHAPKHLTGAKLKVRGAKLSSNLLAFDSGDSSSVQVLAAPATPNTFGEQKIAVLLVNFVNATVQPFTTADANNVVFNTTNSFYKENSFQQTWLSGDVFGWLTLPIASTCDTRAIANAAQQAATTAGINLANYNRYVYMFPLSGCGWSGIASIGGTPSEVWITGEPTLQVVGHELGHNLGLQHSGWLDCGDAIADGTCRRYEYEDPSDIMGNISGTHFNAYQKEQLGWLNNNAMPPITTVSSDGTYSIEAYETTGTGPKALKILKSIDPVTGERTWYYIEYRQPLGFDTVLPQLSSFGTNLVQGILIHTGTDSYGNNSSVLDMTPTSRTSSDYYDAALLVGQSYTDSATRLTITPTWTNGSSAGVNVSFASQSCVRAKPSVLISPAQGPTVSAGTSVNYTVAVTNNDSMACGTSTFSLQAGAPAGWIATHTATTLAIAPGEVVSTSLAVTSASTATAGSYNLSSTASNNGYSGTAAATYSVASQVAGTISTTLTTDKSNYFKGETVTISAQVSVDGVPTSGASVNFTVTKPNGVIISQIATTNTSGQAIYKLRLNKQKDPAGSYLVRNVSTSNGQSVSASTSFDVR